MVFFLEGIRKIGDTRALLAAYTHMGQKAGAAIQASRHGEKIVKGGKAAGQILDGTFVPVSPIAPSIPGMIGNGVKKVADVVQENRKKGNTK